MVELSKKDVSGVSQSKTGLRVLVVDDSKLQRHLLTRSLTRWGYQVQQAASGQEALSICLSDPPDLIVSDWVMPGMNGLEFCARLRSEPSDRYTYFILLTSKSEKNEIAKGLDVGADDFLTKPVNAYELRARIKAGERLLQMQHDLHEKNRVIGEAYEKIQSLYQAIDVDLLEAKKLQQSLMPARYSDFNTAEVSLLLRSSGHVGGDLVGFLPVGPDNVLLYAIDVSGHGIASALMTVRIAGYLSSPSPDQNLALGPGQGSGPVILPTADVTSLLNETLLDEMDTEHYFTLLLGNANLRTGEVQITQAGHPHPALLQPGGAAEFHGQGGLPVGLFPGAAYDQFTIQMSAGDRLLFLSDGITECKGTTGKMLGEDGLAKFLKHNVDLKCTTFLEALMWDLHSFADEQDLDDDVSALLFQYHGPDRKNRVMK